jgi:hypothetical protein
MVILEKSEEKNVTTCSNILCDKNEVISIARVRIPLMLSMWLRTNQLWRSQYQAPLPIIIPKKVTKTISVGFEHAL